MTAFILHTIPKTKLIGRNFARFTTWGKIFAISSVKPVLWKILKQMLFRLILQNKLQKTPNKRKLFHTKIYWNLLFDLFCETNYTKISFFTKCFSRKISLNFQQIARVCIKAFQLTISSRIVKKLAILLILLRNSANFKNSQIFYFVQFLKCIFGSAVNNNMPTVPSYL